MSLIRNLTSTKTHTYKIFPWIPPQNIFKYINNENAEIRTQCIHIFWLSMCPCENLQNRILLECTYWEIRTKTTKCIQKQTLISRMSTLNIEHTACKQKT